MIEMKRILMPTDLSEYAAHALDYAGEFASVYGASLHLLHVMESHWLAAPGTGMPAVISDDHPRHREHAEARLNGLKNRITGIDVRATVEAGVPHVAIVRYAKHLNIDLIVLATHGRTGISHALIGSVAEKVVQMAPCPVLTIKHPEHEFALP